MWWQRRCIKTTFKEFTYKALYPYFGSKKSLKRLLAKHVYGFRRSKRYWHINNNAKVLLVAHMDTVQTPGLTSATTGTGFDDRLGVFLAHKLTQKYPNLFDMLITDYEESGASTAEYFKPVHDYNYIIGLDRAGDDYVDYGEACDDFHKDFKAATGIKKSWGSFSDICYMGEVSCSKINLGIGVFNSHSRMSGYKPKECISNIASMLDFVRAHDKHYAKGDGERWATPTKGSWGKYSHYSADYGYNDSYSDVMGHTRNKYTGQILGCGRSHQNGKIEQYVKDALDSQKKTDDPFDSIHLSTYEQMVDDDGTVRTPVLTRCDVCEQMGLCYEINLSFACGECLTIFHETYFAD